MTVVASAAAVLAAAAALLRWLRVSQREHYLAGSVVRCLTRWLWRRPPNLPAAVAWVVGLGAALLLTGWAGVAAGIATAAVGVALPLGMGVLGSPRLKPTRRAVVLGVTAALLAAGALLGVAVPLTAAAAAALAPAVALLAVDAAAWLLHPVEKRSAKRFQRAAEAKLDEIRPDVVAVTGSYGKTTVKGHIRDLCAAQLTVLATPASWNNQAGLSRAVNEQLSRGTEVFVAEMGTYGKGEIADLVAWVHPRVSVLTAVGPVHLERFRTIDAIVEAKSEVFHGAEVCIVNVDDERLEALAAHLRIAGAPDVVRVGTRPDRFDLHVLAEEVGDDLRVQVDGTDLVTLPRGSLHGGNVACAVAAALAVGVERPAVAAALPRLEPPPSRAKPAVSDRGVVVIDDTFNSNPAGAHEAVRALLRTPGSGRRVVVTPGMVELGPEQAAANRDLSAFVDTSGAGLLVVGWTNRAALLAGCRSATLVPDREAARQWVRANLGDGDAVLWENDLPDTYP